ncbi:WD40 repeat protein [Nocardiopsis terrae]|uniref:WD40 repeat protein n=1 Tax=Nocardiopsis terrae TaxID=372655 RepID=A0ABR9HA51_9ACTN|nr:serine/threonine-protein kinase [Nocardiopsis terrae]MBE1455907.1 WD40 repeat protein [Nocardiopsis terrae]
MTNATPARIGPYRIIAPLGSGGMGHVHLGLGPGDQPVAVKVVRPELAYEPEFRERFAHEVHRAGQVTGGDLPRVLDADTTGPSPWLATQFVLGPSLQEMVRRIGALPEPTVRYLGRVIARTLTHLHASGVVHRDLKPGNVLVAATGPRVIDLGISRAMDETPASGSSEFAGTPGYTAPETARGKETGPAADVFALGAVLAFALTGRGPFGDGHPSAVIYRIDHQEPELDGVPPSLLGLLRACLDKDPARRPTADQALQALGGPVAPAVSAGAWLPRVAVAVLDGFEHDHRTVLRAFLETQPVPGGHSRGRALALVGAAATALVLIAGAGVWAVTGPFGSDEENAGPAQESGSQEPGEGAGPEAPLRERCDPTVHLAPEYVEAAAPEPAVPSDAGSVRFSNDGSVLAVHLQNNVVHLWDWRERTELAAIELSGDAPFREIEFSPDDCLLAHGSEDGAHVYSLETGEHTVHLEGRDVRSVAFSPDGTALAMADRTFQDSNGGVYTVDLATGEDVTRYETDSPRGHSVAYSPSGDRLAAQDGQGDLRVWDTVSGEQLHIARNLPFPSFRALDFYTEDLVVAMHPRGPLVVDVNQDEGGTYYEADEQPEGDTAKVVLNREHGLLYAFYMTEADENGGATLSYRVLDVRTAEDVTPETEDDGLPFALLDVHPDGDVIATLPPDVDEVQIRDAVSLEPIDIFE